MKSLLEPPSALAVASTLQYATERAALVAVGRMFHARGWSLATSSNYSIVIDRDPLSLLLTASGKHKGALTADDFVLVDAAARALDPPTARPSAEALLHCEIARLPNVGAVLHTHSVWGKGIEGIKSHEQRLEIPIFENTQDIPALAAELRERISDQRTAPMRAFLIRRHGLYTWGQCIDDARRHVEALEFLFEVVAQRRLIDGHR
jgi:methylthioribulose-1-phosphate dehydratase